MLSYHNELSYFPGLQAVDRMSTPKLRVSPDGRLDGEVMTNPRARKEPLPSDAKGTRLQGRPGESSRALDRTVRFRVELQIVPDRRMEITFNGPPQLQEAVDELGNSLRPTSRSEENGYAPMRGMIGKSGRRSDGPASVFLHRPQNPGRLIKRLRGTLDISIRVRWPEPVVIPVTNSVGKVLENDEMRVVVKSVEKTDPAGTPGVIELTIEERDTSAPQEWSLEYPPGSPFARHWRLLHGGIGADSPLSRIQVVDSRGQVTVSQFAGSQQGSGPVTLRLALSPQSGVSKEIRLWSIVRATAKIPFEFNDLPMP